MEIVKETYARTLAKTVAYRLLATLAIMMVSYFMFNDISIAIGLGAMVVFLGTSVYYLHDRLWLFLGWNRDNEGNDSYKRSIIKTASYRIIIMIIMALTVKLITGEKSDNVQVGGFVVIQMLINLGIFFLIERIFNAISWGKVLSTNEEQMAQ